MVLFASANCANRKVHRDSHKGSPQNRMILWGEEEQGSERSFRRKAETEPSGLCDDDGARGAAPCSERSDAKQPGHSNVRAVRLAERTIQGLPLYRSALFISSTNWNLLNCFYGISRTPIFQHLYGRKTCFKKCFCFVFYSKGSVVMVKLII